MNHLILLLYSCWFWFHPLRSKYSPQHHSLESCLSFYPRSILRNSRKSTLHFTAVTAFRRSMSSRNLLVEKCLGRDSPERPRSRRDNNIKMGLSEFCFEDQRLIETAHNPVARQVLLLGVLNIRESLLIWLINHVIIQWCILGGRRFRSLISDSSCSLYVTTKKVYTFR
jgi:hypothetical protein